MVRVTEEPLEPGRLFDEIRKNGSGSVLCHYAVVKGRTGSKPSSGILFERAGDIEAELDGISSEVKARWPVDDILLVRRIGMMKVGDMISLVAVSAAASSDAFEACRYGLDRLKKMSSLRKTEMLEDTGKVLS